MELPSDDALLDLIRTFCARHDMAPSTFGRNALGDGSLISNIDEGRSLTLRKARAVLDYMHAFEASLAVCSTCDARPGSTHALACDAVGCPLKNREARAA